MLRQSHSPTYWQKYVIAALHEAPSYSMLVKNSMRALSVSTHLDVLCTSPSCAYLGFKTPSLVLKGVSSHGLDYEILKCFCRV